MSELRYAGGGTEATVFPCFNASLMMICYKQIKIVDITYAQTPNSQAGKVSELHTFK